MERRTKIRIAFVLSATAATIATLMVIALIVADYMEYRRAKDIYDDIQDDTYESPYEDEPMQDDPETSDINECVLWEEDPSVCD